MTGLEIERKYLVVDFDKVRARLGTCGVAPGPLHLETNELYDYPHRTLTGSGRLLRLRRQEWEKATRWVVTFKSPPRPNHGDEVKVREELETVVEDGEAVRQIFLHLGLGLLARYQKLRQSWSLDFPEFAPGHVEVSLDQLSFCNAVEIEGPENAIESVAAFLGLDKSQISIKSYYTLYQDWLLENRKPPVPDFLFSAQEEKRIRRELGLLS